MRFLILTLIYFSVTNLCLADEAGDQAESFAQLYASFCMLHADNLEDLEKQLEGAPQLAPEGAAQFLNGMPGSAWPVPDKTGLFVLAVPENKDLCAVYARRASAAKAEELFGKLVATAAAPLLARKTGDSFQETAANGTTHTISYEWYAEGASRKILFVLTTSSSENAELQVLGTVSIGAE